MKIPELLAPAGNFEKLKIAIEYGADAVYMGGKRFGLRAFSDNFDIDDIYRAVEYAHERHKRVYITMNIFAHNNDFRGMEEYVKAISDAKIDAIILSDPGILDIVKNTAPDMKIHLSTQANTTNWRSASFWYRQGVDRIILARELSLNEIRKIKANIPEGLEIEAFVHGAMCMSYSGRCALSNYFVGRDANRGACAQPCRWKYHLVEEQRPGEYLPVFEDDRGSYILNANDLCMIEHLPDLISSGLNSLKIEGRMKSSYYVATVVGAYRLELDKYKNNKDGYRFDKSSVDELKKASHRTFSTGFYFHKPSERDHSYDESQYIRNYDFIGMVKDYLPDKQLAVIEQRNHFKVGDNIEIMSPGRPYREFTIDTILNEEGDRIASAPHPQQIVYIPTEFSLKKYDILRRPRV
ncbi:MAG: U32 family peptidase [Clostridiales bacterium]|nr:U32 family peptidase [Clostridiales bacterium]